MTSENGIITSATISNDEHGHLSVWLHMEFECGGQGFGGYALGAAGLKEFSHEGGNYAGWFINRCMAVAGVTKWDDMKGKAIRVRRTNEVNEKIYAIGHIIKDDWFDPSTDFKGEE